MVVPLTIVAVVGQQSPDFGDGNWVCLLEESIESGVCYGLCNLMGASMKMVWKQNDGTK